MEWLKELIYSLLKIIYSAINYYLDFIHNITGINKFLLIGIHFVLALGFGLLWENGLDETVKRMIDLWKWRRDKARIRFANLYSQKQRVFEFEPSSEEEFDERREWLLEELLLLERNQKVFQSNYEEIGNSKISDYYKILAEYKNAINCVSQELAELEFDADNNTEEYEVESRGAVFAEEEEDDPNYVPPKQPDWSKNSDKN